MSLRRFRPYRLCWLPLVLGLLGIMASGQAWRIDGKAPWAMPSPDVEEVSRGSEWEPEPSDILAKALVGGSPAAGSALFPLSHDGMSRAHLLAGRVPRPLFLLYQQLKIPFG